MFNSFTDILNTSPEVLCSHDFCSAVCSFKFYLDAPQHNPTTLLFWCGIFFYFFFMSASNSATPLGPSEKTRGQMQTVWKGGYNGSKVFRHNVFEITCITCTFQKANEWSLKFITESDLHLQGFQQKFAFHSKEIVAISCSWCKQAVSLSGYLQ